MPCPSGYCALFGRFVNRPYAITGSLLSDRSIYVENGRLGPRENIVGMNIQSTLHTPKGTACRALQNWAPAILDGRILNPHHQADNPRLVRAKSPNSGKVYVRSRDLPTIETRPIFARILALTASSSAWVAILYDTSFPAS